MPSIQFDQRTKGLLQELTAGGQYKHLQHVDSPMGPTVKIEGRGEVICLCSNDYLGLTNHPKVKEAAKAAVDRYACGLSSSRVQATTVAHVELEDQNAAIAALEREDYAAALKRHYDSGPPADWQDRFVTAYASAHPLEDWAETWAHDLHMTDTLEMAASCGVSLRPARSGRA